MNACMILMCGTTQQQQGIGQWVLGVSLLVLGENEVGLAMVRHIYSSTGWRCSGCRDVVAGPEIAQICLCCLEFFCSECAAQIHLPRLTRFCISGHRRLDINPFRNTVDDSCITFRNSSISIEECMGIIAADWSLADASAFASHGAPAVNV
jgi:hypothetical protein